MKNVTFGLRVYIRVTVRPLADFEVAPSLRRRGRKAARAGSCGRSESSARIPTTTSPAIGLHPGNVDGTPHRLLAAVPAARDGGNAAAKRDTPRSFTSAGADGRARVTGQAVPLAWENR